jgi:glycyl-tRNA synthetase beta chain
LAVADKLDSICGCFAVGLIPTGASDPYALRRQGIGIMNIMLNKNFAVSLNQMIMQALRPFAIKAQGAINAIAKDILTFLKNRMSRQLADEGFSKDVIAATISTGVDSVPDIWSRVKALQGLKGAPDFEPLAIAFKRVVNIIRKAEDVGEASVDEALFQHASELDLLTAFKAVQEEALEHLKAGHFEAGLLAIASLRDPVDAFFDGVLVMAEEADIRRNRLALLGVIAGLFSQFADFSKLTT